MPKSQGEKLAKSSTVHSVVVAAKLLEFLADSGRPQRVTDISLHLGMTKARVSRHLSTLNDLGMVVRMPDKSGYRLGPTLFRLSNAALDQYEITNIAYRYMVALRNQVHEALLLAIPAGGDALIVSTVASGKALSPELVRGSRLRVPISPTAGVVLAFARESVRERVLARRAERHPSRGVVLDPVKQRQEFKKIQDRFYAFHDDPHDAGFAVLSAPIFNHAEGLEAALTLVMNRRAGNVDHEKQYLQVLMGTAIEISRALGSLKMAKRMAEKYGG
ncbi:MAG: helix-turn-helix domain-containing protein [Woeseiaceae bacterium]|nr:helix-turn-helix domain-containing protein [Woeseiaceae bacterium]